MRGNFFPEMTSVMWPSPRPYYTRFGVFLHTVYTSSAPSCIVNLLYVRHLILVNQLSALPITYLPTGSFGVQYLSPEVTVKVTAQLLPLNAQRALFGVPPYRHIQSEEPSYARSANFRELAAPASQGARSDPSAACAAGRL